MSHFTLTLAVSWCNTAGCCPHYFMKILHMWWFENSMLPQCTEHLNSWSPAGSAVWVSSGGVTLLDEMCHCGLALRFQKPHVIPSSHSLLPAGGLRCELSVHRACLLPHLPPVMIVDSSFCNHKLQIVLSISCLEHAVFIRAIEK